MLLDNTTVFKYWYNLPIPLYLKIYLFNVTNPDNAKRGQPPMLTEVGPYVYRITAKKKILKWGRTNKTLSFDYTYLFNFEETLSEGKETDIVSVINLPAVATAEYAMRDEYESFRYAVNSILQDNGQELFINLSIKELLFQGYEAKFLHELAKFSPEVYELLPDAMFGIFYGQNNSGIRNVTVFTGMDNKNLLGKIYAVGGKRNIDKWDDPYCNMINGSDGGSFPPGMTSDSTLKFYLFQLERSFVLQYVKTTEILDIPLVEFTLHPNTFDSPEKYPGNKCFCDDTEICQYNGMLVCKQLKAAKVFISNPHFTGADERLYQNYIGIKPDKEKYKSTFSIQPTIGFTLDFEFKIQFNILITPSKEFRVLKKFKQTQVFPVLWFSQTGKLTKDFAEELYGLLIAPVKIADIITMIFFGLGVTGILASIVGNVYISQKKGKPIGRGKITPANDAIQTS